MNADIILQFALVAVAVLWPTTDHEGAGFLCDVGRIHAQKGEIVEVTPEEPVPDPSPEPPSGESPPPEEDVEAVEEQRRTEAPMQFRHDQAASATAAAPQGQPGQPGQPAAATPPPEPFVREGRKVGRNEACPCGSGKKYKHCHGKLT